MSPQLPRDSHASAAIVRWSLLFLALVLPCRVLLARPVARTPQSTAPFSLLDKVENPWVSQNAPAVRPMVLSADENHLYAVNVHASRVDHFQFFPGLPTKPVQVFHTPRAPVSIGLWDDPSDPSNPGRLLVVCRDSYCLVVLDRGTGDVRGLLELRDPATNRILGEPGDLLIDPSADRAFISCSSADAVAEVQLSTLTVVHVWRIPGKHPLFMTFDPNKDVLVAPMLSGNNSGSKPGVSLQHQGPTVLDLKVADVNGVGLPDRDLFRLVRSSTQVQAVTTRMGTVMFACGVHPVTGIWQLGTEAHNKDPLRQTQASIQGDIVENRLSIAPYVPAGSPVQTPTSIKNLDSFGSIRVGQPYGLYIHPSGYALVTGLLTDNVAVLDQNGNAIASFAVANGGIPRATLYSQALDVIFVYCWGNNTIEAHSNSIYNGYPLIMTFDLGLDPTPAHIREGRRIFYDGAHSALGNASCASCHVEGRTDMVLWNLSSDLDDKGPMVTQTLNGINRTVPFHWRGEQQQNLIDFNPAFVKLLGATAELSPADFELFEDFVLSLEPLPNPFENENRLVDNALFREELFPGAAPLTGRATAGQSLFLNRAPAETCVTCHAFPASTNNDIVADGDLFSGRPRRQFLKVAPFLEMYRKEQDGDPSTPGFQYFMLNVGSLSTPYNVPYCLTGVGLHHTGAAVNAEHFASEFPGLQFGTPQENQDRVDVAQFMHQWDQGLAPATYRAVLLNQATYATSSLNVGLLETQALQRNCDLVLFGKATLNGSLRSMRWNYNRTSAVFMPEDTTFLPRPRSFFDGQAQTGIASVTAVGLPVGMGEGFGDDFDRDGLFNADEVAYTLAHPGGAIVDPDVADSDGDTWLDGHETANSGDPTRATVPASDTTPPTITSASFLWATTRAARLMVQTSEPCVLQVTYGATGSKTTELFGTTHSVVLDDLSFATSYAAAIVAQDRGGNWSNTSIVTFSSMPSSDLPETMVTRNGSFTATKNVPAGTLTMNASVRLDQRLGGTNLADLVAIARVFKNGQLTSAWTAAGTSTKETGFQVVFPISGPYSGLKPPFLFSSRVLPGQFASLSFSMTGLAVSDEIVLNIEMVGIEDPASPPGNLKMKNASLWSMPSSPAGSRSFKTIF